MDGTLEGQVGESKDIPSPGVAGTAPLDRRTINVARTKVLSDGNVDDVVQILFPRSGQGYRASSSHYGHAMHTRSKRANLLPLMQRLLSNKMPTEKHAL